MTTARMFLAEPSLELECLSWLLLARHLWKDLAAGTTVTTVAKYRRVRHASSLCLIVLLSNTLASQLLKLQQVRSMMLYRVATTTRGLVTEHGYARQNSTLHVGEYLIFWAAMLTICKAVLHAVKASASQRYP